MFGTLLERPRIKPIIEPCYHKLLESLHNELDRCKQILDRNVDNPKLLKHSLSKAFPPAAGAISWSTLLLRRINSIMDPIELMEYPLVFEFYYYSLVITVYLYILRHHYCIEE
ncbi:unnamed protein product [Trichobilharzia regenti]|nr:unnamed protein product [Trichobilharzia regenti]